MGIFAFSDTITGLLGDTVALSAVALIGYLFGQRTRRRATPDVVEKTRVELCRATKIAKRLQQIADQIRQDVATHQASITKFTTRVRDLQADTTSEHWQSLSDEAEVLLVPTMKLTSDLSFAYDQLRRQSTQLMTFAGSRTDAQTGVYNRHAMEEQLEMLLSIRANGGVRFSLALICSRDDKEHEELGKVATNKLVAFVRVIENCTRETDFVARFSDNEFVVLMPNTTLAGATVFSERLIQRVCSEHDFEIVGGVAEVQPEDTLQKLLSRADSALYSARAQGRSCLFQHNGKSLRCLNETRANGVSAEAVAVG